LLPARGDRNRGALRRKQPRYLCTYSGAATGDQNDFAFDTFIHCLPHFVEMA
jgi:hypothetical protein